MEFNFSELNWSSIDVSPDGKTLVFDSLGDLYVVPIGGGHARVIRSGPSWDMMPRFSRDGKQIVFSSNAGMKTFDLWAIPALGGHAIPVAEESFDLLYPEWTSDGQSVVAYGNRGLIEVAPPHTSDTKGVRSKIFEGRLNGFGATFANTQHHMYFSAAGLQRLDTNTGQVEALEIPGRKGERIEALRVSPDGETVAYLGLMGDEVSLRLADLKSLKSREIIPLKKSTELFRDGKITLDPRPFDGWGLRYPNFSFTPDSKEVVVVAKGRILRINVQTGLITPVKFRATFIQDMPVRPRTSLSLDDAVVSVKQVRWPNASPDGEWVTFSALGKVWRHDIGSKSTERLTQSDNLEFAPAVSPNGRDIAYVVWKDNGAGHIMRASADFDYETTPITVDTGLYLNPTWSHDGKQIVFLKARKSDVGSRQLVSETDIQAIDIETGEVRTVVSKVPAAAGDKDRPYSALVFSRDGERIYYNTVVNDEGGLPKVGLFSVNSSTGEVTHEFEMKSRGRGFFQQAIISPDGLNVAIVEQGSLWIAALIDLKAAAGDDGVLDSDELNSIPNALVSKHHPSYVSWKAPKSVIWSVANQIYETSIESRRTKPLTTITIEFSRARPDGAVAYTNARAVTMSEQGTIENATIIVQRDKIRRIGASDSIDIPSGTRIIDLSGKTIIPGFIDTHDHPHGSNREYFSAQRSEYLANLAYGVTTIIEVSASVPDVLTQAEMVSAGEMIGPRVLAVGRANSHGSDIIDNADDAKQTVSDLRKHGAWAIKSYELPHRNTRQWLIEAANEEGLSVITHYNRKPWAPLVAIEEGHIAIEHLMTVQPFYEDWLKYFAASGVHYTPTLLAHDIGQPEFLADGQFDQDPKLRRFLPKSSYDGQIARARTMIEADFVLNGARRTGTFKGLTNVLRSGGKITMSSHGEVKGLGGHLELWSLVDGGFTPLEALSAATLQAAYKLGLEDEIGSLQEGHFADFVILNKNPLDDIRNSDDIKYIVKNGVVYDGNTMTQLYPVYTPPPRLHWYTQSDWNAYLEDIPAPLPSVPRSEAMR
ncbi:amidohydrolase family protein [Erythrobacter aureus]|uniref:amidohydrolase family protein n=1 Tax=Erythrobacter aureus TaxID=2182384 RepID=UPI003A936E98